MKDISYEILDLFKKQGSGRQALEEILAAGGPPQLLYALSPIRENLLEWLTLGDCREALLLGADYGALAGLLSRRCGRLTIAEERDENLEVARERWQDRTNIVYKKTEEEGRYDLIVLSHLPKESDLGACLGALAARLNDGGRLVFACENSLGLAFLGGAAHDEDEASFTCGQLERACRAAGLAQTQLFYTAPEHRLPTTIYSRAYVPASGELPLSAAYSGPRYACLNEAAVSEQLAEEGELGRFANGFLVVASRDAAPQETIFVKYNSTRRPAFRLRTAICEQGGRRWVEKRALAPEGGDHIASLAEKYEKLSASNPGVRVLKPQFDADDAAVRFPFLSGTPLSEILGSAIKGRKAPVGRLNAALKRLFGQAKKNDAPFAVSLRFTEVFGEIPPLSDDSYCVSNIDGLFENMIETEEGLFCLDYEWVFDFPVPAGYVHYRCLAYFYYRFRGLMDYPAVEDFLAEFGIRRDLAAAYAKMEAAFQTWVHGDAGQGYLAAYSHRVTTLEELKGRDEELSRAKERILQLQAEVEEKNLQIRKEQEVQRLTNNHVNNLSVMIKDLRHEVDELGKLATYLNKHEALVFKARRKLGVGVNKVFPKGTRKRKLLNYAVSTVRHPLRYGRLYATAEGRNRIEGDFKIGEAYLEGGCLQFEQVAGAGGERPDGSWDGPMVSIVIPCYNQVGYTYACLRSILAHTGDVTYEVIIADDVSTDATAQLDRYVKGLTICRNETNQGFLLNCNNAARAARGKYILFLNNDTQVTPGWLSSLVRLIESDPTIGMVGSKLVYPDGRLQEAGGIIWSDGSGWNYGRMDDPDKPEYNYVKDVDYISGASIMLSRALWNRIGGFDTRYVPAYCEDADLAFEVRRAGYRVVYQPLSKVIHFEGVSNGTDVNGSGLKRYQTENFKKLKEKWKEEFKQQYDNNGNPDPFRARERSRGKRIILVVDHYVPTYDKDAGSKATFLYLKMFLKKGFVVKFLGDNFQHEEPYTTALQQLGIEVLYGDTYATGIWDWLKKNGDEIAVAYLNRPHIATHYIDFIRDYTKIKIIYFGHDLHFLRLGREYELTGDLELKRQSEYWKSVELTVMHKAAISYYPSSVEIDVIHSIDASIPAKAISLYVYDQFLEGIQEDFARREDIMFVGGFGHPPNADAVLWFAQEIFPRIREKLPQVHFNVVGSKVPPEIKALEQPDNGIHILGFVSDEELARRYAGCKLVVVPLRYGAGVKGKVLEALYNGAPVITTSIGAEGIPFVDTALEIEDEPEAFADKVIALYGDNARCAQMCRRTQEYIKQYFSLDSAWKTIEKDFTT